MDKVFLWSFEGGYLLQHAATIFQILKMIKRKNSECVSLETNILFLIGSISRIFWLPNTNLNDLYITYIELLLGLSTLSYAIFLYIKNKDRNYYSREIKIPIYLKIYVLLPFIAVLSFFLHPGNKYFSLSYFISFGIFSESFGLLPQLYIIKKSKDSGDLSKLYVVFLALARFLRLSFWILMFISGNNFLYLIIADILHTLALSNFVYNTIKNWSGKELPISFEELKENTTKKMF